MKATIEKKDGVYLIRIYGKNGKQSDAIAVEKVFIIPPECVEKYDGLRFYKGLGIAIILGIIAWAIWVVLI